MKAFLLRHGRAVQGGPTTPDEARWLTAAGRADVESVAQKLVARGVGIDVIVSSPLVRAVQTAELVAHALGYAGPIEALPMLSPDGMPSRVPDELAARGASVLAVGHEPTISALAGILLARRMPAFRTAQVLCVEPGATPWSLEPSG